MNSKRPESVYIQDGVVKGNIFGAPILVDSISDTLTFVGYGDISREELTINSTLLIKKIVTTGSITEISHAYGEWSNRVTLDYIGY